MKGDITISGKLLHALAKSRRTSTDMSTPALESVLSLMLASPSFSIDYICPMRRRREARWQVTVANLRALSTRATHGP
jgi:hypothetical protein